MFAFVIVVRARVYLFLCACVRACVRACARGKLNHSEQVSIKKQKLHSEKMMLAGAVVMTD